MFPMPFSLKWFLLGPTLICNIAVVFGKEDLDDSAIRKELTSAGCEVKMMDGRLVEVTIPANVVPSRAMPWVVKARELEQLTAYCPVTDEDVSLLGEHIKIRLLRIGGTKITNRSLGVISQMSRLEDLMIFDSPLNEEGLQKIRGLTELQHLSLVACPNFTGKGLEHLAGLGKLRWIELWKVTMRDGEGLSRLDHVGELWIRQSRIEPGVLAHAAKMKNLKSLSLVQSTMDDESLAELKDARQLERIAFTGASVSDKGMIHLYDLKQLQQITVAMSKVSEEGARKLRKQLPNTTITE